MWLFLLRRKPKTILKEPSWCHRALRRNRDIHTSSELWGVSSMQNLSVHFCFNFVLKKQWSGEPQKSLVKDKHAVQKGYNSKYNPQLLYSLSFWKSFWATAEVDWSQWKDGCRLPQPLLCNVWRGSGLNWLETGPLMLLLKKWTEMGYVFKVPFFHPKTIDSALYNCGFDHVCQLTFHFSDSWEHSPLGVWSLTGSCICSPKELPGCGNPVHVPSPHSLHHWPCNFFDPSGISIGAGRHNFVSEEQVLY